MILGSISGLLQGIFQAVFVHDKACSPRVNYVHGTATDRHYAFFE